MSGRGRAAAGTGADPLLPVTVLLPPLSLYVHIPFCAAKCPYCDFASTVVEVLPERSYLDTLVRELTWYRRRLAAEGRPLHSIFIGGGTPSLLRGETIAALLRHVRALWPLEEGCEITLEANPESATADRMALWRAGGVNRLSLGIQAFDPERLAFLGRIHTVERSERAIAAARDAGFERINLDLIHTTPGQTVRGWREEMERALTWEPGHVSAYQLTLEPGTPFFGRYRSTGDEEQALALFEETRRFWADNGLFPYEISNFSRPGQMCRHNLNYWRFGDYLGVGAAAHGKLTGGDGVIRRTVNPAGLGAYMAAWRAPVGEGGGAVLRAVSPEEAGGECWLMGLRLAEGMRRETCRRVTGRDPVEDHGQVVENLLQSGFLTVDSERVALTARGVPVLDAILARLA